MTRGAITGSGSLGSSEDDSDESRPLLSPTVAHAQPIEDPDVKAQRITPLPKAELTSEKSSRPFIASLLTMYPSIQLLPASDSSSQSPSVRSFRISMNISALCMSQMIPSELDSIAGSWCVITQYICRSDTQHTNSRKVHFPYSSSCPSITSPSSRASRICIIDRSLLADWLMNSRQNWSPSCHPVGQRRRCNRHICVWTEYQSSNDAHISSSGRTIFWKRTGDAVRHRRAHRLYEFWLGLADI